MFIEIDFNSEEAFYIQLRNQIIIGIAMNQYQEGDSLPSVRQLADRVGINMHTVNKAYSVLKQEGFIRLDRRKGAVIVRACLPGTGSITPSLSPLFKRHRHPEHKPVSIQGLSCYSLPV